MRARCDQIGSDQRSNIIQYVCRRTLIEKPPGFIRRLLIFQSGKGLEFISYANANIIGFDRIAHGSIAKIEIIFPKVGVTIFET